MSRPEDELIPEDAMYIGEEAFEARPEFKPLIEMWLKKLEEWEEQRDLHTVDDDTYRDAENGIIQRAKKIMHEEHLIDIDIPEGWRNNPDAVGPRYPFREWAHLSFTAAVDIHRTTKRITPEDII